MKIFALESFVLSATSNESIISSVSVRYVVAIRASSVKDSAVKVGTLTSMYSGEVSAFHVTMIGPVLEGKRCHKREKTSQGGGGKN